MNVTTAPKPWYLIVGSTGDEAEAEGIDAAELAARTFVVDDGNEKATIYLGERTISTSWMVGGRYTIFSTQGLRRTLR